MIMYNITGHISQNPIRCNEMQCNNQFLDRNLAMQANVENKSKQH